MQNILEYKGYYGSVYYSTADEVLYGKLIAIEDLVNFEGTSVAGLKKAFHHAVNDYLATCKRIGKEPNKTYKGTFNVRVTTELHKAAAVYASLHQTSLNDFVNRAIQFALSRQERFDKILKVNR
jgi:predicted HicB family RNase H-like nuclease